MGTMDLDAIKTSALHTHGRIGKLLYDIPYLLGRKLAHGMGGGCRGDGCGAYELARLRQVGEVAGVRNLRKHLGVGCRLVNG